MLLAYDEGIVYINVGETGAKILGPVRGGYEFTDSTKVENVEYDGKRADRVGDAYISEIGAQLKLKTLSCAQDDLALAIPGAQVSGEIIKNPTAGWLDEEAHLKNICVFTKLTNGSYKKVLIKNPIHVGGFSFKTQKNGQVEIDLDFKAYADKNATMDTEEIYEISDVTELPTVG